MQEVTTAFFGIEKDPSVKLLKKKKFQEYQFIKQASTSSSYQVADHVHDSNLYFSPTKTLI